MASRAEVLAAAQGRAREVRAELDPLVRWVGSHPDDAPESLQAAIAHAIGALYATEDGEPAVVREALERAVEGLRELHARLEEAPAALRPDRDRVDQLVADLALPQRELDRVLAEPDLTVRVDARSENNFYTGFTGTIDEGGLYVSTWDLRPEGTEIRVGIGLPGANAIVTRGVVAWVRETPGADGQPGMGLALPDLDAAARQAVTAFMQRREPMFHEV